MLKQRAVDASEERQQRVRLLARQRELTGGGGAGDDRLELSRAADHVAEVIHEAKAIERLGEQPLRRRGLLAARDLVSDQRLGRRAVVADERDVASELAQRGFARSLHRAPNRAPVLPSR